MMNPISCQGNGSEQFNGQEEQQPNSPNQKIQNSGPLNGVEEGQEQLERVSVHDDTARVNEEHSAKAAPSSSNGENDNEPSSIQTPGRIKIRDYAYAPTDKRHLGGKIHPNTLV